MPFSIQFVRGSLSGRRFPVGPEPLLVGRSHSCAVRPKESDVSGRHLSLAEEGGSVVATILSAHRTVVAGARVRQGGAVPLSAGSVVELGDDLAFRVMDDAAAPDETSTLPAQETGTLPEATEGLATAATRFGGDSFAGDETGTFGDGGTATAATRFGGDSSGGETGTLTAATRFGAATESGETSILGGPSTSPGESGEPDFGETQVLETQVASREELDRIKETFQRRNKTRMISRAGLFGLAVLLVVGVSAWLTHEEPEPVLEKPSKSDSIELLPELLPQGAQSKISGYVGMTYPSAKAEIRKSEGVVEIRTWIGRHLDVPLVIVAEAFVDPRALHESREATFQRYLENSQELVSALDGMESLPLPDFFGGKSGFSRGIPCSVRVYRRFRGKEQVFGVISLLRNGSVCLAVRREVPESEELRARHLLERTRVYLYADSGGRFGSSQWEGSEGAGCDDCALELAMCKDAMNKDFPDVWPDVERGLRNIFVETSGGSFPHVRSEAFEMLATLRARKVVRWKQLTSARAAIARDAEKAEKPRAEELAADARRDYSSPDEEWYHLARRTRWWE